MAHGSSRLTPHGRRLVVDRVLVHGWRPALVAEAAGISRATVYKWVRRFRAEGAAGLCDRSSRPRRSPRQVPQTEERRILKLRLGMRRGPNRLAPIVNRPASTVYAVLRRNGVSRLRDFDRVSRQPIRYVRERPGELVHMDVKKLGRIPPRGGHRFFGRAVAAHRFDGRSYDFVHVAVDDASRLAFVAVYPDQSERAACDFVRQAVAFYSAQGVSVERLMTDQHPSYRLSRAFHQLLADLGVGHRMTRRYRPQTNGKAERFIQTLLDEWAYSRLYRSNVERLLALPRWVNFYNRRRPHSELGDRPPVAAAVNNVPGDYT
jgi:transposase InsO family protein